MIITHSSQETIECGKKFASMLEEKDVVILTGELGAGKTTFVQGVLDGFALGAIARSPTFTLMRQYRTKHVAIYHVDLYRIQASDTVGIGLDDYIYSPKSITLIEWGEKIIDQLPRYIKVDIAFARSQARHIKYTYKGLNNRDAKIN